jgi:hypothetical protein
MFHFHNVPNFLLKKVNGVHAIGSPKYISRQNLILNLKLEGGVGVARKRAGK